MDRAAAELFLAALFVESTPERLEVLRNAAKGTQDWHGLLGALEGHGVLPLFTRNLVAAGVELPTALAGSYQARANEQRSDDRRTRLTLTRFLAGCARGSVEATLVGASALTYGLYAEPWRRLGEVELFVAPEHFARALTIAEEAGLLPDEGALPGWWHCRTGLALRLKPASGVLRPITLSSRLHHPSLLLTAREPEVLARRKRLDHEGFALFQLAPLDALLELATTLATRAGESLLVSGRRHLLNSAAAMSHPLRLAQLLDLRTFLEAEHTRLAPAEVLTRAKEWSAEPALRAALECLQMGLGFLPGPREWSRQVAQALAAATPPGPNGLAPALFRPDPIERLPLWVRPSDAFLAASQALPSGSSPSALRRARARHLVGVASACLTAAAAFPLALVQRQLERGKRRRAWENAKTPARLGDVNEAWKSAAARAEQQKPLTPRSISLPSKDESVARYPDRYAG